MPNVQRAVYLNGNSNLTENKLKQIFSYSKDGYISNTFALLRS